MYTYIHTILLSMYCVKGLHFIDMCEVVLLCFQSHTEREMFVWWEEPTTGKDVWRYSYLDHGELSVTLHGLILMLMSSVDSCNILQ